MQQRGLGTEQDKSICPRGRVSGGARSGDEGVLKLLKNNVQPCRSEDRFGFAERFTNQAVAHPATRRMLREVVKNGRFLWEVFMGRERAGIKN